MPTFGENAACADVSNAFSSQIQGKTAIVNGVFPGSYGAKVARPIALHDGIAILVGRKPNKVHTTAENIRKPSTQLRELKVGLASVLAVRGAPRRFSRTRARSRRSSSTRALRLRHTARPRTASSSILRRTTSATSSSQTSSRRSCSVNRGHLQTELCQKWRRSVDQGKKLALHWLRRRRHSAADVLERMTVDVTYLKIFITSEPVDLSHIAQETPFEGDGRKGKLVALPQLAVWDTTLVAIVQKAKQV